MKKVFLFLSACFFIIQSAASQEKLLSMEDAVLRQRSVLAPAGLKQLMWIKGTNGFSTVGKEKEADVLFRGSATGGTQKVLLSLSDLNAALSSAGFKSLNAFPSIQWKNANEFTFEAEKKFLTFNTKSKKISAESSRNFEEAENQDVSAGTGYVAFTTKNNLFVFDGKEVLIVTNDADENIVNGKSVHREEFGIYKGTFWSPSGNLLAYYRMDQTMVTDYPVIDWAPRPAKNSNIKYPMAGDKSHEVTVGIYNVSTGKTVFLKTGEPKEQYLTNIAWSGDEQLIYIAVLNRDQNEMQLNSYNAGTGLPEKTLFTEKQDKYVHPTHTMMFLPGKSGQFIWQSERDGYNHLYLYNADGSLVKQLTKGTWIVTSLAGFDSKVSKVFYTATTESGITRNFYSVDLKTGKTTRITSGDGTHTSMLSSNGNYIIDNFQSTTVPKEIAIYSTSGKKLLVLKTAENPLKEYKLGELSLFSLKSESGDDLFCRLFKPADFDSTKKYPVIVYLYNGPGVQLINNTWNGAGDLWFQYMAQRGFVVFTIDGRGSANRGLAFEQASFRKLGSAEMKDQLVGINYLKSQKYVDAGRMGIFGWSYGGFMTTSIMTHHPDLFKAAVAGGPVIDWSYYEVMYTERYMDTPESNPEGYKETSLLNHADKLKGKLMIIHGTADPVVVWQHSLQFLKTCIEKGKQVDYFVYPGHEHNVLGKDRAHLFQKITDYFMQNL